MVSWFLTTSTAVDCAARVGTSWKVVAGRPADVHGLAVGGGEGVGRLGAPGGELHVEAAELPEVDLVAQEHLFAQAVNGLGEHGRDVGAVVGAAVVGDVLGEGVHVEDFVHLSRAVGLRLLDVFLLRSGLGAHDDDRVVDHNVPPPVLPFLGGGVLYSAEGIAVAKVFLMV